MTLHNAQYILRLLADGRRDDAYDYAYDIPGATGHAVRALLDSSKSDADVAAQLRQARTLNLRVRAL